MEIAEKGYGKNYKYDKLNDLKNLISFKTSLTHDPPPDEIRESLRGLLVNRKEVYRLLFDYIIIQQAGKW